MIDHRSYAHNVSSVKLKSEKNSGINGIQTHDLYDTSAVFYQLRGIADVMGTSMSMLTDETLQKKLLTLSGIEGKRFEKNLSSRF